MILREVTGHDNNGIHVVTRHQNHTSHPQVLQGTRILQLHFLVHTRYCLSRRVVACSLWSPWLPVTSQRLVKCCSHSQRPNYIVLAIS